MSEREDVEALAAAVSAAPICIGWTPAWCRTLAGSLLASSWLAVHDELVRADERKRLAGEVDALDDAVCSCIMAARWGKCDGRTVESHLSSLLDDVRALVPVPGVRLTEEE